jgi:hypothetical protein
MNIQCWKPDTCNCVVYTNDGTEYYDVESNPSNIKFTKPCCEEHCSHHTQTGQAFVDENKKTNDDCNHKYFKAGDIIDKNNPAHKIKLEKMAKEKAQLKKDSNIVRKGA